MSTSLPPLSVYLINAFTSTTPHSGNQAGVVIFPANDPRAADDEYKLKVAKDINYSETAFLVPIGPGRWNLRWFTPEVEVALCGHATLASARVLFSLDAELQDIVFENHFAGELRAKRIEDNGNATKIKISLPTFKDEVLDALIRDAPVNTQDLKSRAAAVLGVEDAEVLAVAGYPFGPQARGVIIQLRDDVDLGSLSPDAKAFTSFSQAMTIVTQLQPSSSSVDRLKIRSRVFVAPFGIDEDPVTGSAHAYLTAYYLLTPAKDGIAAGFISGDVENVTLDAEQLSARSGKLKCRLAPGGMVDIVGSAAETARGTLTVW